MKPGGQGKRRRVFDPPIPDGVERELRFHLEQRIAELEATGMSRQEASREARRRFGDVDDVGRKLVALETRQLRRARWSSWLRGFTRDLRLGVRHLSRRRGFALVAVLTLGLGIGANTAIYSVVDAVLVRPLPYARADGLVMLWESEPTRAERSLVRPAVFLDWRDRSTSFSALEAYRNDFGLALTGDGDPIEVHWAPVTVGLFSMLGVRPVLGRLFTEEEGEPGRGNVVLMSHATWQSRYGGDPGVLGRNVVLDGSSAVVVGVLPPEVALPSRATDFWSPLVLDAAARAQRSSHQYVVLGRLAPSVTPTRAQSEMAGIAAALVRENAEADAWTVRLVGLRQDLVRDVRQPLLLLFAAVGLVLLVACGNVSNLLLAQAVGREREVAVRAALGARRAGLVRQFLAESFVLAAAGGLLAALIAWPMVRGLVRLAPDGIPLVGATTLDPAVFAFTILVVLAATLFFGMVPALRASRPRLERTLSETRSRGGGGRRHARMRRALVVGEVALSLVLLAGSGLLVRSLARLRGVDTGYDPSNVLAVSLSLPVTRYGTPESQLAFWDEVLTRVRALPGVQAAAGTSEPPVVGYQMTRDYRIPAHPDAFADTRDDYPYRAVTDDWFETVGAPVLRGRAFDATDRRDGRGVVMVNEAMASLAWPGRDAVGQRIEFGTGPQSYDVVGVVGDTRHNGLDVIEGPVVYAPYVQKDWAWLSWMTLMVRTDADPLALAGSVRNAIWAVDANLPIQRLSTVESLYAESLAVRRFTAALLGIFAALGVALALGGLYGVMSWGVADRGREIGVRIALGASRWRILAGVLSEGAASALTGIAIGLVVAATLRGTIEGLLFELQPLDPVTLGAAGTGLLAFCVLASLAPALRATRQEPVVALRAD